MSDFPSQQKTKILKVAHIVPSMDIGGVETGILRSAGDLSKRFDYKVFFVKKKGKYEVQQQHILTLFTSILKRTWFPDIVITSLWYSHPIGWILSKFGIRWFASFHLPGFSNKLESLTLRSAWRLSNLRICDSVATQEFMNKTQMLPSRVVPYVFKSDLSAMDYASWAMRPYDFIWVGRNVRQKRVDLLVKLLANLKIVFPDAKAVVILAGDESPLLNAMVNSPRSGVEVRRNLVNSEVLNLLKQARFYLTTSDDEGMSLTTVEAVQAGCVAVVRPIGEIPNYLDEGSCIRINQINEESLMKVATTVAELDKNSVELNEVRAKAMAAIEALPKYTDELRKALEL